METVITGKAYVLGDNIDTDQIIPANYLSFNPSIPEERKFFGMYAMSSVPDGQAGLPDGHIRFVRPNEFKSDYQIVIGGKNFGCGSSREHAPWAIADYGFRAIVAPSYADIFYNNCFKNGILPVTLRDAEVEELFARTLRTPGYQLSVDLEDNVVYDDGGFRSGFSVDPFRRKCLLKGLDDIGLTLEHEADITTYENRGIPTPVMHAPVDFKVF